MKLAIGGNYNFKGQKERLTYSGKVGKWHQFEKIGEWGVWAEILDYDLHLIQETLPPAKGLNHEG